MQPYTLPRNLHEVLPTSTTLSLRASTSTDTDADQAKDDSARATLPTTIDDTMSEDGDDLLEEITIPTPQHGEGEQRQLKPKTMLELVEAAERKQDMEDGQSRAPSSLSPHRTTTQANADGARATTQNGDTVAHSKDVRTPRRAEASRGRKRRKASPDESQGEAEEAGTSSARATPAKRARKTAPPVPASTRVLRARPQKSAAKIQEERAMEEAYRKAVAE